MAQLFLIAFLFSFLGSIPPGSINLSVIRLALDNKYNAALRFAVAAALVELPYAFVAVQFEGLLTTSPLIVEHFKLLAALVMIVLGVTNLSFSKTPSQRMQKMRESGFRRGLLISILNPLAIPFWLGVTAYLNTQGWIQLTSINNIFVYIVGISFGTFVLLALLAILSNKIGYFFKENIVVQILPGIIFIVLGAIALVRYLDLL
ncbi:hypothetical protein C900_04499 [Fulvivirga imtechensis AK7]|uniref:Uncharacterized protein n=1 Tax=Fulvivirga imtechensis AK7 TaxID=1237149 RepID=L8JM13_9BACT|nr:LysE family transporter [Fulvivirga imtechensis]ELR69976.1 hypothetical protein C900_04499 [Fulvivirga imtechensis AK7]